MEKIFIGNNQAVLKIDMADLDVNFRLLNVYSQPVIDNITATWSDTLKSYVAEFNLTQELVDANGTDYRGIFSAKKSSIFIPLDNYLIEYELFSEAGPNFVQLVQVSYYKDYIVNSTLSPELKDAMSNYPDTGLQNLLLEAQSKLADKVEISFYPVKHIDEKHDFYKENFAETWWIQQLFHSPLLSVEKFSLVWANFTFMDIDVKENISVNKEMGTIQFIPNSFEGQTSFSVAFWQAIQGLTQTLGVSPFTYANHIPDVYHIDYTAGLDFILLPKDQQNDFKDAICRRCSIEHLPRIDPTILHTSVSKSVDGVSKSQSYGGYQYIQLIQKQEKEWVDEKKRKFGTHFKMHVA